MRPLKIIQFNLTAIGRDIFHQIRLLKAPYNLTEQFQWWGIHNFMGQPVPVSHHSHNKKKILPYIQYKSTLFEF